MAYLFKYDSTHGIYPGDITTMGSCLIIDGEFFFKAFLLFVFFRALFLGQRIECTHETEPNKIPWSKNCTEYVVESSGHFTTCADATVS